MLNDNQSLYGETKMEVGGNMKAHGRDENVGGVKNKSMCSSRPRERPKERERERERREESA